MPVGAMLDFFLKEKDNVWVDQSIVRQFVWDGLFPNVYSNLDQDLDQSDLGSSH